MVWCRVFHVSRLLCLLCGCFVMVSHPLLDDEVESGDERDRSHFV